MATATLPSVECERIDLTPDHVATYEVRSRSRASIIWNPVIDLGTGLVDCQCENFEMKRRIDARKDGAKVDIGTSEYHCRHIEIAIRDCIKRGDIILDVKHHWPELINMAVAVGLPMLIARKFAADAMRVLASRVRKLEQSVDQALTEAVKNG